MKAAGVFLMAFPLLFLSCHHNKVAKCDNPEEAAIHYVQFMAAEEYDKFLAGMVSCDSASVSYKKNMIILFKQMVAAKKSEMGGLKSVKCVRSEKDDSNKFAKVFLSVTYHNDSTETMVMPLVRQDDKWRMR